MSPWRAVYCLLGLALGFRSGKLEFVANEPIQSSKRAFVMRKSTGSVASWGNASFGGDSSLVQSQLKNVKALCGTCGAQSGAFAAIVGDDNTVICWGDQDFGGDCSAVASELKQVEGICSSAGAFAALKRDGTVTTWGHKDCGGDSASVQSRLEKVKAIYSTYWAFAAVLNDDTVEAWGNRDYGGLVSPSMKKRLKRVRLISGTFGAFAALLGNGQVETWGDQGCGGDSSMVASKLTRVVSICASQSAFAALKKDGTVVSWGGAGYGGDCSRVQGELKQVVAIAATAFAFAALKGDGRVLTWGSAVSGGDSSNVELKEVVAIQGATSAFAALRKDGTVTTWGYKEWGGDSSAVQSELAGVVALSSTARAFAARKSDGTVVTWGDKDSGGDSSSLIWRMPPWVFVLMSAGWLHCLSWLEAVSAKGFFWVVEYCVGAAVAAVIKPTWALTPAWVLTGLIFFSLAQLAGTSVTQDRMMAFLFVGNAGLLLWCCEWLLVGIAWALDASVASSTWDYVLAWTLVVPISSALAALVVQHDLSIGGKSADHFASATLGVTCFLILFWCCFAGWWLVVLISIGIVVGCLRTAEQRAGWPCLLASLYLSCFLVLLWRVSGELYLVGLVAITACVAQLAVHRKALGLIVASIGAEAQEEKQAERQILEKALENQEPKAHEDTVREQENFPRLEVAPATPLDGSVEFWVQRLQGVEIDIPEAASKLSKAGFKHRHISKLSEDRLIRAGLNQGTAMDVIERLTGFDRPMHPLSSSLTIPEEALVMEEIVGEGGFAVVWKATWTRKIAVGEQLVQSIPVAVKMSTRQDDLARDLAVSALPHQNILNFYGICRSRDGLKLVFELMSTDLAQKLKHSLDNQEPPKKCPLLPTHELLRVLRDVSAGLAHLHKFGVFHNVKPANILLRDEQAKLCGFGSKQQQMTPNYLAPEALEQQSWGRPADVWSFGVLLFECVTGRACAHKAKMEDLRQELTQRGCLPALVEMFEECRAEEPSKRPSMLDICDQLQRLVMQEAVDSHRLKEELKRAEAQDRDTYEMTWNESYGNQPYLKELLDYSKQLPSQQDVRQPKGSMEELGQLALLVGGRLHESLKELVEGCGGTYLVGPRKKYERCVQKVNQEYGGDFGKLLDLERATGLFDRAEDMLLCLQRVHEGSARHVNHFASSSSSSLSSPTSSPSCCSCCSFSSPPTSFSTFTSRPSIVRVVRCKDRLNNPRDSGYRDILLNVCEEQSGFVAELQLNFHKIAQINSQSHRFYEFMRVMQLRM